MATSELNRFEAMFVPEPNTGCWLWLACVGTHGYGYLSVRGQLWTAHRAAFALFRGPIPAGACVCHRCDVRSCVNPAHLFLGTAADNNRDRARKGRSAKGERSPNAKWTADGVREAQALRAAGWTLKRLAARYGISRRAVSNALRGDSWAGVTP